MDDGGWVAEAPADEPVPWWVPAAGVVSGVLLGATVERLLHLVAWAAGLR